MTNDVMTPSQRHLAMSHNRGRTSPERSLASGLWLRGLRYLTHEGYKSVTGKQLSGKPDMVFSRKRIVIFVDGCFWHGCPDCDKSPEQSGEFWVKKIETNKERDQRVTSELKSQGWTVLRVPEHDVRTKAALTQTVHRLLLLIQSGPTGCGNLANGDEGV